MDGARSVCIRTGVVEGQSGTTDSRPDLGLNPWAPLGVKANSSELEGARRCSGSVRLHKNEVHGLVKLSWTGVALALRNIGEVQSPPRWRL
ncbi:hypothetical protein NDU88_000071 [Pleurodeles waltl]|uniref:Uncharacterized protein n=1 Tax=Pleurodeles waltl TaxID=8319 RepID=A0AAV7KMM3_PLEWA|nr:hypothetical protein NDU88_000071 [Pleurodeles waltl]